LLTDIQRLTGDSECFARKLAGYAGALAARYPWVHWYTPVNEPLTTARFSGLYGHWFPHGRDEPTFWRTLRNQCRGTVLAMRAIRRVQPAGPGRKAGGEGSGSGAGWRPSACT